MKTKGAPDWSNPGTGKYVYQFFVDWPSTIPVIGGGETIGYLVAQNFFTMTLDHFKDGNIIWENVKKPQEVAFISQKTGESFTVKEFYQKVTADQGLFHLFYNFQGSKGMHYIAHLICDYSGTVLEAKSVCL